MKISEHPEKGICVQNCQWIKVQNEKESKGTFQKGEKNRIIELTDKNEHSTRSHTILIISIEKLHSIEENEQNVISKGFLYLVDLAGSESIGNFYYLKGKQLEQAKKINKSLLVLGNCISSIIKGKQYIPYRESQLTRILKDSLCGNSNISLIVTLSPSSINTEETYSSLNFGTRAQKVKTNPKKNIESITENPTIELNKKYIELLEKFNELDLKYKENLNKKEMVGKESIEKFEEIIEEKQEIINKLNSELDKEKLINKITSLQNKELNKKLTKLNNINKNNNKISLEPETIKLLSELGIEIDEINNKNINLIIKRLINDNKQKENKNNILNISLEQIKKNYEDKFNIMEKEKEIVLKDYPRKIEFLEKENDKLQNINNINLEKINKIEDENNQLQKSFSKLKRVETEKNLLDNKIRSLNEQNSQLKIKNQDIENKYQTVIKKYEESKVTKLNNYSNMQENIKKKSEININEKKLNNNINLIIQDLEIINILKKESKGIETIIESDIPSLTERNYDIVIKKANYLNNKMERALDNIDNLNNTNNKKLFKAKNLNENITKLNEVTKLYKDNFINIYKILKKTFNKVIELCQKNQKNKEKLNDLFKYGKNDETNSKNKIFEIILSNIDEFQPLCYSTDNSDLKEELNNLKKESEELNSLEILENATTILKKLILRSSEFRKHKEKEIRNLNNKINYYLREIDNYKKYYNNHKTSDLDEEKRLLNNQLFLQDGEIIRLNKENDKLLKTIKNLMNKNAEMNIDNNNNE